VSGKLILCGTPIGNLEDISARALRALSQADVVACEDTRRTRKLLAHHQVKARSLVAYHDANERRAARMLVRRVAEGSTVVLVSDAGMPGLSDPGYRLVQACLAADLPIEIVPGPSAGLTALAVSGLPAGRFVFEGFLPRKHSDRRRRISELGPETRTLVIYESPHRIEDSLSDLLEGLGDRPASLARELTKRHEEVRRGTLSELLAGVRGEGARGEIVLVIGGAVHEHKDVPPPDELASRARALMESGTPRREAMAEVARTAGVPKREVFDALVKANE
jgi:16S rRNA (cytidine1402-2'-O)-methyltransferase